MACRCVCVCVHVGETGMVNMSLSVFIHVCVCSCSCMYINCMSVWLPPPSPIPACQWCGPLIGGPGLSRHGNCTKANKGVERSRGNTVTQRGYLAQWKISGEAHTKPMPALSRRRLLCLSLTTTPPPRHNTQSWNLMFAAVHKPRDFKLIPCLSLFPALELLY